MYITLAKSSLVLYSSAQFAALPFSVQLRLATVPLPGVRVAVSPVGFGQEGMLKENWSTISCTE